MEKTKRTAFTETNVATYFYDQGLILTQNLAFGDFMVGTGNATWQIDGQLVWRHLNKTESEEIEIKLASWDGAMLTPFIDQSDESDAISADCDYLYTAIAPGWLMDTNRKFLDNLTTNTGEAPMEKSPQEYYVLLLPELNFTEDAFREEKFLDQQCDKGIDAFLKTYDSGFCQGIPSDFMNLVTVAFLQDDKRVIEAFKNAGWNIVQQTDTGSWVACRIFEGRIR